MPVRKKVKQIKRRVEIIDGVEVALKAKRKDKSDGSDTIVYSSFVDAAIRQNEKRVAEERARPIKKFTRLDEIAIDLAIHRARFKVLQASPIKDLVMLDVYTRMIASIESEELELLAKKTT